MIADLKPYPEYKESGLPWLRQVPGHWDMRRSKYLFREVDQRSVVGTETRLSMSQRHGLIPSSQIEERRLVSESNVGGKLCEAGDLVLNRLKAHLGVLALSPTHGLVSPDYTVLRPVGTANHRYFCAVYRSPYCGQELRQRAKGIVEGFWRLYTDDFYDIRVPLPPPDEQAAIVRFLDWANGRLERAIRAKRKVIALLKEQKQAIIHRAVTRGLDPSVPLKPSGIPWLGNIPQHWEVRRLKSVLARNDGGVWGSDFAPDGTIVLRSTEQAMDGSWQIDDPAVIRLSDGQVKSALLEVGDIVVTKSSGSPSHIGKSSLVTREIAEMRCCYSNFMQRLRTAHELAPEYLNLFLNSKTGRMHYQYSSTSTTGLGNLTRETIATLPIPVPDRSEQARVLDGVRQRLEPIDEAASRLEREIDLLREYRTRLVADVVTGKLDVRVAAARLPDEIAPDADEDDADLGDETEAADEEAAV